MTESVSERSDCPNCDDGGRVRETPEAGYATCLDCGERGYWRESETEWWRNDPDSQWYIDTDNPQESNEADSHE
jgi:hypothetical protein